MIGFVEAVEGRPIDAEQRRLPVGRIEPVEIDQQAHHAIVEAMAGRLEARMRDLAEVKHRGGVGRTICLGGIVQHQDFQVAPRLGGQDLGRHLRQKLAQLGAGLARGF